MPAVTAQSTQGSSLAFLKLQVVMEIEKRIIFIPHVFVAPDAVFKWMDLKQVAGKINAMKYSANPATKCKKPL